MGHSTGKIAITVPTLPTVVDVPSVINSGGSLILHCKRYKKIFNYNCFILMYLYIFSSQPGIVPCSKPAQNCMAHNLLLTFKLVPN